MPANVKRSSPREATGDGERSGAPGALIIAHHRLGEDVAHRGVERPHVHAAATVIQSCCVSGKADSWLASTIGRDTDGLDAVVLKTMVVGWL
jgi:hypothetical protein